MGLGVRPGVTANKKAAVDPLAASSRASKAISQGGVPRNDTRPYLLGKIVSGHILNLRELKHKASDRADRGSKRSSFSVRAKISRDESANRDGSGDKIHHQTGANIGPFVQWCSLHRLAVAS